MIIAGADPGAMGAIALLDANDHRVVGIVDMPMAGAELLVRELHLDIAGTLDGRRVGTIYIERQAPFVADKQAKIGATTAFNLGQRYMAIKAIAACNGWPAEIVSAARWKRHFGLGADKEQALDLACKLLPEDARHWSIKRGRCTKALAIGRAEAALIGLYGLRDLLRRGHDGGAR